MSASTACPVPGARAAATEQLQWLTPAPLWTDGAVGAAAAGLTQPWIAELTSDAFVPELLGILAGAAPASPADLAHTAPAKTVDDVAGGPYKLFQPLSQRYYMVTASLVCRRPGIPDHAVAAARGERTGFVFRQLAADGTELAWVPQTASSATPGSPAVAGAPPTGTWVTPSRPDALVDGEETLPMHPAAVGAFATAGTTAAVLGMEQGAASSRSVFYGYIPVGRRERMIPTIADSDAVMLLATYNQTAPVPSNPIADELLTRVIYPWRALQVAPDAPTDPSTYWPWYGSLYLLLDLADWLGKHLPQLYQALCSGTDMPATSQRRTLQDQLGSIQVITSTPGSPTTTTSLTSALAELQAFAGLVTGAAIAGPTTTYDLLRTALPPVVAPPSPTAFPSDWLTSLTDPAGLYQLAVACLAEEPDGIGITVPQELSGLIKNDPVYVPPGSPQTTYVIRAVFEHAPCEPVLSAPTRPFVLARAVDGDAPARKIRIQLPDIGNLRGFQRGVALEMPPSLTRLVNRVTPDILKGGGLSGDGGLGLGLICSFSIQIIFLCAFIVLFIFLLLLNIVFFWLPFLKICFPIPVPTQSPPNPSPGKATP